VDPDGHVPLGVDTARAVVKHVRESTPRRASSRHSTPYAVRLPNPGKHLYPAPLTPISVSDFRERLSRSPERPRKAQLYVHLPFCENICTFCPIYKFKLLPSTPVAEYVELLKAELRELSHLDFIRGLQLTSVYFGGGTPSLISDRQLAEIAELIFGRFSIESDAQMTFEGHVGSLTREKLRFVKSLGFQRVSTGVQTFDPGLRHALNLTPTGEDIERCMYTARDEGLSDFNLDLMFNLPGQTTEIWRQDLEKAVALSPSGLDLYEAVIAQATPLDGQVKRGELPLHEDPAPRAENYRIAEEFLSWSGFEHKNLFVWDRPGFQNRLIDSQLQLRDEVLDIVGAGLSAYSMIDGTPFLNDTRKSAYRERVRETGHGVRLYHDCSLREKQERFMIMSLQNFELDRCKFKDAFGENMDQAFAPQLASFRSRGLVEETSTGFRLSSVGRAWASTMAIEFFGSRAVEEILRSRIDGRAFWATREDAFDIPVFAVFHPTILRGWPRLTLTLRYIKKLRRANGNWLRTILALVLGTARRYGSPEWGLPKRKERTTTRQAI
jgi:coproporphyrinogen III oxidase-like Fe-S oxidoreductase